ncbi:SGNH/GDSL hydrolase family protein [Paraliobacillus ryukyuensis]|uniref:SGNH/GDSL hydrolase family protein n=1 Tax=Paraliobacillus ryukyuensis TaxID=200904 RepID=UPI0009A7A4FF|nr:SGNH/GDSL hydrolase family protein [Paraliobacillus ryukyuensis]
MQNKRIVFIGDSITEWGRTDSEPLGTGYVNLIHDYWLVSNPNQTPEIINKGVGGDRVVNLQERWNQDVLALKPDILSVSIGINDVWRQLDNVDMEQVYPERFESIYRELLEKTIALTNSEIILMEPTIIEETVESEGNQLLKAYVDAIHRLGSEFNLVIVPTHTAFLNYLNSEATEPLTIDGVHMNSAGNMLMAKTWLETYDKIKMK